ncbi:MAG: hypothetical protein AAF791_13270, partial [Bacteroidota bacterium]
MIRPLVLLVALMAAAPAVAQGWNLNPWSVRNTAQNQVSSDLETWTSNRLVEAGRWFRDLGFKPPELAQTGFSGESDRKYVVQIRRSSPLSTVCRTELGEYDFVQITLCARMFYRDDGTLIDPATVGSSDAAEANRLATPVHELFHAVQEATLAPHDSSAAQHGWIVEGTAVASEYAWNQKLYGTFGLFGRPDYTLPLTDTLTANIYSLGHFWYRAGDLLTPADTSALAALRFVFAQSAGWPGDGVAAVDQGLREAAAHFESPRAFASGISGVYPYVLAQFTDERYHSRVDSVSVGAPALATLPGTLEPLASAALKVQIDLDEAQLDMRGVPVRFTLDTYEASGFGQTPIRDQLHLIVGETVAGRPALSETPFTYVEQVFSDTTLFVRVANVAEEAAMTERAQFSLQVEVEGYYGAETPDAPPPPPPPSPTPSPDLSTEAQRGLDPPRSDPSPIEVAGELPPGFDVIGPGPWACSSGPGGRAIFDLMTPDELGRDIDRVLPEATRDMEDMMDQMEVAIQRAERMGQTPGISREQLAELRRQAEAEMAAARAEAEPEFAQAADEFRAERTTKLGATFVGQVGGRECQMTLNAELVGREGGAQIVPGAVDEDLYPEGEAPNFGVGVFSPEILRLMTRMSSLSEGALTGLSQGRVPAELANASDPFDGWEVCTMTQEDRERERRSASRDCRPVLCTAGTLTLESAEQGRIAGTFEFEVIKWPEEQTGSCRVPEARDVVRGVFNVASTDDGTDD